MTTECTVCNNITKEHVACDARGHWELFHKFFEKEIDYRRRIQEYEARELAHLAKMQRAGMESQDHRVQLSEWSQHCAELQAAYMQSENTRARSDRQLRDAMASQDRMTHSLTFATNITLRFVTFLNATNQLVDGLPGRFEFSDLVFDDDLKVKAVHSVEERLWNMIQELR